MNLSSMTFQFFLLFPLHALRYVKDIIKAVLILDVLAEIPAMPNLEQVRAKQLVTCLYLYHKTIGNRQKALIRIPFMVKHIVHASD